MGDAGELASLPQPTDNEEGLITEFYDYLKHLTTLSTGSLVLLVTFAEKFGGARRRSGFFVISLVSFLFSVICSLICMLFTLSAKRYSGLPPDWEQNVVAASFVLSALALVAGVMSLTLFGILSVRKPPSK